MTETLLVIHVLAAAAWLGGGFLSGFTGPRMAKAGGEAAIGWMRVLVEAAGKFFLPAAIVVLLSGILMVTFDDAYDWSAAFVGIGLAVAVIGIVLAWFVLRPATQRALAAASAGDFQTAAANGRRAGMAGQIIGILLVLTEIAMVLRLGA